MRRFGTSFTLALASLAGACSQQPARALAGDEQTKEPAVTGNDSGGDQPVRQLPFSHGRSFATLDEYLEHLRNYAGPVGQPWYRKVGTDRYELVTTARPAGEPQFFTRDQLMRRFGFSR
jgi:hypothetical protein